MAVTLTQAQLSAALRMGSTTEENAEATRLLAYATEAVTKHAPEATDVAHNEAAIRLAGYLFDQPSAGRGMAFANALRNSGAGTILLPYRIVRAGSVEDATAMAESTGTITNPVTDVQVSAGQLVVSYADGTTASHDLPAGMGGGPGVDQVARDLAATAQATADTAQSTAETKAALSQIEDWAETGNNHLIPPEALFGQNHENNRNVVVNTQGNFQLIAISTGGGGGPIEVLINRTSRIVASTFNGYRSLSPAQTHTLSVEADKPIRLGLVAELDNVSGQFLRLGISLAGTQASVEVDNDDGEILGSWNVLVNGTAAGEFQRESTLFDLWPHITGEITLHLVTNQSGSGSGSVRNIQLLKF